MIFEFKTPKNETKQIMSDVASGKIENTNFEKECEKEVCELTNAEFAKIAGDMCYANDMKERAYEYYTKAYSM